MGEYTVTEQRSELTAGYRPCADVRPATAKLLLLMLRDITDENDAITIPQRRIADAIAAFRASRSPKSRKRLTGKTSRKCGKIGKVLEKFRRNAPPLRTICVQSIPTGIALSSPSSVVSLSYRQTTPPGPRRIFGNLSRIENFAISDLFGSACFLISIG